MNLKTSSSNILKLERSNKNKCHFKLPLSRTSAIHDEEGYNDDGVCCMLVMSKAISLMPAFFLTESGICREMGGKLLRVLKVFFLTG